MNIDDIIESAQLKGRIIALNAQVETLTAELRCLEAVIRSHERVDCLTVANLKAENARLRKAGTEMGKHLPDTDEANRAYIDFEAGGRQ
jgi:hypothetical protein